MVIFNLITLKFYLLFCLFICDLIYIHMYTYTHTHTHTLSRSVRSQRSQGKYFYEKHWHLWYRHKYSGM